MHRKVYFTKKSSLPLGTRECDRLKVFKRELKDYLLNTIRLVILIDSVISFFFVTFLHSFAFSILFVHFIFYIALFLLLFAFYILRFVFANN